ncbi:MAG: hypothetical protein WC340_11915 [Kiritimatiellia bacterium]
MLRYQEQGELHMDFHANMNATVEYIGSRYGQEALRDLFRATAHNVYRSIYEKLKAGDWSELIEHWQYFMEREGADYSLGVKDDMVVMQVRQCPAVAHLHKLGLKPSEFFCDQTVLLNEAWCEGTPFEAVTEITGDGSCVQRILLRPLSGRNHEVKIQPPSGRNHEGKIRPPSGCSGGVKIQPPSGCSDECEKGEERSAGGVSV